MKAEKKAEYEAAGLRVLPYCGACVANATPNNWGQCLKHKLSVPVNGSCPDFRPRADAYASLGSFREFLVDPSTLHRGEAKEKA
jgi:hypothetical protein